MVFQQYCNSVSIVFQESLFLKAKGGLVSDWYGSIVGRNRNSVKTMQKLKKKIYQGSLPPK